MSTNQTAYSKILKNVLLFGGVQMVQVLATVVRGKFVALFLGTVGIGVNAIFNSVILMLVQFSGLGIQYSAIRELSAAAVDDHPERLQQTIRVFRSWMYACAGLGALLTLMLAGPISRLSFGHSGYYASFMVAAIVVALNILNNGNVALLQGTQRLLTMALVTVLSAIASLLTAVPIYYIWGIKGIVPAIITASVLAYCTSWFYTRPFSGKRRPQSVRTVFQSGRSMVVLGIAMMVATLLGTAATYLINAFIRITGSLNDVGLYSAGISITNQYVGVIFTALAADYFPKLAAVAADNEQVKITVNTQAEIVMLISAPLLAGMMLTAPLLIKILLSDSFLEITSFVRWASLGIFLKAASFSTGYISFAKGDKKTFFLFEGVFGSALILATSVAGYWLEGITGIAKGMVACYTIYLVSVHWLSVWRYQYWPYSRTVSLFVVLLLFLIGLLAILTVVPGKWGSIFGGLGLVTIVYKCYRELDKRVILKQLMKRNN